MKKGAVDSLKLPWRWGCSPNARKKRCTLVSAMGRPKAELARIDERIAALLTMTLHARLKDGAMHCVVLSEEEQAQLQSITRSRSLPAALVRRASIVLACAAGASNSAVAGRFGTIQATVGKCRRRFVDRRIEGLHDELRPRKPHHPWHTDLMSKSKGTEH
jgi:hypothetical protein